MSGRRRKRVMDRPTGEGARGQSIVKDVQALKRGLRIAKRRGSLHQLPDEWPKLRRDPPNERQRGKLHPVAVMMAWLGHLKRHAPEAWRQASTAVRTGLRAEELRKVRWDWVEEAPAGSGVPKLLRVPAWAAKNRRERAIGLTPEVEAFLRTARAQDGLSDETPLLPGQHRKAFAAAAKAVGHSKSITLRDLRHCHATWAAQGTGDAAAAQAALGHTDLRTTQRYLSSTLARTASAAVAVGKQLDRGREMGAVGGVGSAEPNCHTRPSYQANSGAPRSVLPGRSASGEARGSSRTSLTSARGTP